MHDMNLEKNRSKIQTAYKASPHRTGTDLLYRHQGVQRQGQRGLCSYLCDFRAVPVEIFPDRLTDCLKSDQKGTLSCQTARKRPFFSGATGLTAFLRIPPLPQKVSGRAGVGFPAKGITGQGGNSPGTDVAVSSWILFQIPLVEFLRGVKAFQRLCLHGEVRAVSYTHLDVYKRQRHLNRRLQGRREFLRFLRPSLSFCLDKQGGVEHEAGRHTERKL